MSLIPKKHKLIELFSEVDNQYSIEYILDYTEIETTNSLKTVLWELRKNGLMDIRMKFGMVRRVE